MSRYKHLTEGWPKITIVDHEDWSAVFIGDEQIHYHDTLSLGGFLSLIGADYDSLSMYDLFPSGIESGEVPGTLKELLAASEEEARDRIQAEIEAKEYELQTLKLRLAAGGKK